MIFRHLKIACASIVILLATAPFLLAQVALRSQQIKLANGSSFNLKIPVGYNISVAAQGMRRFRFLAKSPDGKLFGTDMHSLADNKKGKIYLFEDWDDIAKRFKKVTLFADNLHNPNQILFYSGKGISYMYVAETDKLTRYNYHSGDTALTGTPQVIAHFPDRGLSYKYGGWHLTRSLAAHNDKIYVSVGSSCNACVESEAIRATILEMNPDGSGQRVFASGIRNAVAIKWFGNKLWATFMSRDLMKPDVPEDLFGNVEQGRNYGWPWYYQLKQRIYKDRSMADSAINKQVRIPGEPPLAYNGFKAHSAPLGFDQFTDFNDPNINNNFIVALHGSTSVWRMRGNAVVMITGKDKYVDIVANFQTGKRAADRHGRPCDVLMNDKNSFFVTDDKNGVLYYIWKQ